jgi:hypothetical protein
MKTFVFMTVSRWILRIISVEDRSREDRNTRFMEPGLHTRYSDSLRAGLSGDRIPVGAKFSAPVQTGRGPRPPSYTVGTGSFPGVKRPDRGVDHSPPSITEVKVRVELYLYFLTEPSWPVLVWTLPLFPFTQTLRRGPTLVLLLVKQFSGSLLPELNRWLSVNGHCVDRRAAKIIFD